MKNLFNPFQTIALLCSAFACQAFSTELITSVISVEGNAALFTTDTPKTHTLPSCITTDNAQKWSVNAEGSAGDNGLHQLINIAKNSNEPVAITSANNCDIIAGIEQASNINIVYKQEDETQTPIDAVVSSALNFVAQTTLELAEGTTPEEVTVAFGLSANNGVINWQNATRSGIQYSYNFGQLPANSNYALTTKATIGSEENTEITHFTTVDYIASLGAVREDSSGNLYVQINNKVWKLTINNSNWEAIETSLTDNEFNNLSSNTTYTIEFGEYTNDSNQDFKLVSEETEIIFDNSSGTYLFYQNENPASPSISAAPQIQSVPTTATGETISLMAGEYRTDESGAATYSIPLSLPSGIAGVSPSLSLSYNSSSTSSGVMGIGWSLSGLSGISRCRETVESEGKSSPLTLTNNDSFCFNGQKLILISGENGAPDSEYRTEIDGQLRIYAKGTSGTGPSYFTVEAADGSISYYGSNSDQSRSDGRISNADDTIISWLLSTVMDNLKNTENAIEYNYIQPETVGYGQNEVLLSTINYSGHNVSFNYNEKALRTDTAHAYIYGTKIERKARLDNITVNYTDYTNPDASQVTGSVIKYNLQYHEGSVTYTYPPVTVTTYGNTTYTIPGGTRTKTITDEVWLKEITQCNNAICLPSTSFDWTLANEGNHASTMGSPISLGDKISSIIPLDVNGDGHQDMLKIYDTGNTVNVKLSLNAGDKFTDISTSLLNIAIPDIEDVVFKPTDIDGDGYVELLYLNKNSDGKLAWFYYDFYREAVTEEQTFSHPWKEINRTVSYTVYGKSKALLVNDEQLLLENTGDNIQLYDADGDALVDLIYRHNSKMTIHFNKGNISGILNLAAAIHPTVNLPAEAPVSAQVSTSSFNKQSSLTLSSITTDEAEDNNSKEGSTYVGTFFADEVIEHISVEEAQTVQTTSTKFNQTLLAAQTLTDPREGCNYGDIPTSKVRVLPENIPVVDFNGDGIADLLMRIGDVYRPTGCRVTRTEYYWAAFILNGNNYEFYSYVNDSFSRSQSKNNIFVSDFNGDGLGDVLYYGGEKNVTLFSYNIEWRISYSTGLGFTPPEIVDINDIDGSTLLPNDMSQPSAMDYDNDGRVDIVYFNKSTANWNAINNNGESFDTAPVKIYHVSFFDKNTDYAMLADFEGKGYANFVTLDYAKQELEIKSDGQTDGVPINKIAGITNGFGLKTNIIYQRLNDHVNPVYTKGYDAELITTWGNGSPVYDLISPMYVVSQVMSDTPSYNDAGDTHLTNNTVSVSYAYEGLRAQAGGRGMLGFEKISSLDNQTGITTTTEYRQDYPYIGRPVKTESYDGEVLIKSAVNEWKKYTLNNGSTVYPYLYRSTEKQIDIDTGTILSTTQVTNTYTAIDDNHQNLTSNTVEVFVGDTTEGEAFKTTETVNKYDSDSVENWWLARLTKTTVTHNKPSETEQKVITRISDFTYNTEGMLATELINGLTTLHCYDDFGNEKITISHANVGVVNCDTTSDSIDTTSINNGITQATNKVFRRAVINYDTEGRYILSQGNDKFTLTTINTLNGYGQPTKSTNIDGAIVYIGYDNFGRQFFTSNSFGEATTITRAKSTAGGEGSYFKETSTSKGKPTSVKYFDKLGRNIRTAKQSFDGSWVYQDSRYDQYSRMVKSSNPYYSGDTVYWNSSTYDKYGRVTESTSATGITNTPTYTGLTYTSLTAADDGVSTDQTTVTVSNIIGEKISTVSNASTKAIRYEYNAVGNLTKVINIDDVIITTMYDDYGRKISMNDPSKGDYSYTYNAAGEITSQTTNKLHKTYFVRDTVGRTVLKQTRNGTAETAAVISSIDYSYGLAGESHRLTNETNQNFEKLYDYDSLGRIDRVHLVIDETYYTQQTTYDEFGRIYQQFDAEEEQLLGCFDNEKNVKGSCLGIQNHYNSYGYLHKQSEARNGSEGQIYYEITSVDAFGNVTESKQYNKDNVKTIVTTKGYDSISGAIKSISATSNGVAIQNNTYNLDDFGNLRKRTNDTLNQGVLGQSQEFGYDNVNRLTTINNEEQIRYHENGNIKWKYDVDNQKEAFYCYEGTSPYAVSGTDSAENCTINNYVYDLNGNMTKGRGRDINYSHFDKAILITNTTNASETSFKYDTSYNRYKRTTTENIDGSDVTTYTYYIGNIEVISKSNSHVKTIRRNLPNAVELRRDNNTSEFNFLLKDHLGSLDTIVDSEGFIKQKLYFDPWGKKHTIDSDQILSTLGAFTTLTFSEVADITTRGYTGHESVDHADIIHMNGRIYDPTLGRFLQADPHIQAPSNSQSYNRYAYVLNNPLSMTDPSGYFFKSLYKAWMKADGRWAAHRYTSQPNHGWMHSLGTAALGAIPGGWGILASAHANFDHTFYQTGSLGAAFHAGGRTAAMAGTFHWIGGKFDAPEGSGAWNAKNGIGHIAAHAVAGGIISDLQGGKFGHGFWSAGFTKGFQTSGLVSGNMAIGTIQSAVVGGTVSELTGGKFANGAVTAAFQYLYNYAKSQEKQKKFNARVKAGLKDVLEVGYDLDKGLMGKIVGAKDGFSASYGGGKWTFSAAGTSITVADGFTKGGLTFGSLSLSVDNYGTLSGSGTVKFLNTGYVTAEVDMYPQAALLYTIAGQRIRSNYTGSAGVTRFCNAAQKHGIGC